MIYTYDLLPVAWGLDLPQPVCDALVDMGIACNEAALTLYDAHLEQRRALVLLDGIEACAELAPHRGRFARLWFDAALSYTDQLTGVYTLLAGTFAGYATRVAAAVAGDGKLPSPDPRPVAPSLLLGAPEVYLPLVQMPVAVHPADAPLVEHNSDLAARHRGLVEVVDVTCRSHPIDVYDDPATLANRPSRSLDLGRQLADALHAYAATCAWAAGLKTRPPSEPME